jgi:arylsulfatase A-like enzyme
MQGIPAIRDGSWKPILGRGSGSWSKGGDDGPDPQLYDLAEDIGEEHNLAAEHPERVAAMKAAYETLVASGRSGPASGQPAE